MGCFARRLSQGDFKVRVRRAGGHTNIAADLREMSYASFHRPLDLIRFI